MKIDISKEWCLKMARREADCGADVEAGVALVADQAPEVVGHSGTDPIGATIVFGRLVRMMRRKSGLTVEKLAEAANVDIDELVGIEDDTRFVAEPRTVYQLSNLIRLPLPSLMQLAGLSEPKDPGLVAEAIRFAARSDPLEELSPTERAALEAFVAALSARN